VELIYPAMDTFVTANQPTFCWHSGSQAVRYQLQVSSSQIFISRTIDITTTDTTYTTISEIPNNTYFWRVRSVNQDTIWGDWSDARVWSFFKSDYVDYINFRSSIFTYGVAQDVFVRGDTAYIADGQADLTIVDVSNKDNPSIIRNIDTLDDDFARGIYIAPNDTVPYAFVADGDGRVQAIHTSDTSFLYNNSFGDQNIENVTGSMIQDTSGTNLYIFSIRARSGFNQASLAIYQIVYDPVPRLGDNYYVNPIIMPSNPMGLCVEGNYVYLACSELGIVIVDITDIYNPVYLSDLILSGASMSVAVKDNFAYVAADRAGLFVVDVTDKANPAQLVQINTSGRAKDISIVGDYAFIADASGGLKVIDITVPAEAHFVAAYSTPYAYGVWADSGSIYICDRDEGLVIFDNVISR